MSDQGVSLSDVFYNEMQHICEREMTANNLMFLTILHCSCIFLRRDSVELQVTAHRTTDVVSMWNLEFEFSRHCPRSANMYDAQRGAITQQNLYLASHSFCFVRHYRSLQWKNVVHIASQVSAHCSNFPALCLSRSLSLWHFFAWCFISMLYTS